LLLPLGNVMLEIVNDVAELFIALMLIVLLLVSVLAVCRTVFVAMDEMLMAPTELSSETPRVSAMAVMDFDTAALSGDTRCVSRLSAAAVMSVLVLLKGVAESRLPAAQVAKEPCVQV
jgi:hypothetical protein